MNPNLDELFSELFAYRIMLQDSYENESDIIREIKNYLIEIGITISNIPQIIHEFYKNFGYEISLDVVNQACTNQMVNNILSFTLSSEDFDNTDPNDQHIIFSQTFSNPINDNADEESSNEASDDENNNQLNIHQLTASNMLNNDMSFNQLMAQNMFQYVNFINGNLQNHWVNNPVNHGSLVNVINNLVNNNSQSYQNVVVSMDDKEIEKLDSLKLESNLDSNCSICMGQMEKEEFVTKLVCTHTFHTDCIQPYLKQYNYKCPVCRTELGKVKYSL
jgi:hypothetical protein